LIFLHFFLQLAPVEGRRVIVECPLCHTRYRTESSYIIEEITRFQCTKDGCEHIFHYTPPLLEGVRSDLPPFTPPVQAEVSSSLVPDEELIIPLEEDVFPLEEAALTKSTEQSGQARIHQKLREPKELSDRSLLSKTFNSPEAPFYSDVEAAEREHIVARSARSESERTVSPGIFILFLGLLIFGNGVLGLYCFYHPATIEAVLTRLPLLGGLVAGERVSARHIVLGDLEGRYQTTKDSQKVFTISGTATNNAALAARTIQIEGIIYDAKKKVVGQRLIFCGTNISPDRLTNLTLREIGALQDLVPPKQFRVTMGDTVKFLIVFTSPPLSVAEFSSRVVTAQFSGV